MGVRAELAAIYGTEELSKAINLLAVLDEQGIAQTDVMAMSEGAINSSIAAMIAPERFRNMIFIGPAGMIGKDNVFKLLGRFMQGVAGEHAGAITCLLGGQEGMKQWSTMWETWKRFRLNAKRAFEECGAIAEADIVDTLKTLRAHGIGTCVVSGVDDVVFEQMKINENLGQNPEAVDGYLSVKGGHYGIANDRKHAEAMENLLSKMEQLPTASEEIE